MGLAAIPLLSGILSICSNPARWCTVPRLCLILAVVSTWCVIKFAHSWSAREFSALKSKRIYIWICDTREQTPASWHFSPLRMASTRGKTLFSFFWFALRTRVCAWYSSLFFFLKTRMSKWTRGLFFCPFALWMMTRFLCLWVRVYVCMYDYRITFDKYLLCVAPHRLYLFFRVAGISR